MGDNLLRLRHHFQMMPFMTRLTTASFVTFLAAFTLRFQPITTGRLAAVAAIFGKLRVVCFQSSHQRVLHLQERLNERITI